MVEKNRGETAALNQFTLHDFKIEQEIARCGAGSVFRARHSRSGKTVVLKSRRTAELGKDANILHEVNLLQKLDHPNIIKCIGHFWDQSRAVLYIILEYAEAGDLASLIKQAQEKRRLLSEGRIWGLFLPIMNVASYLHQRGIIHRDFKPLNVFLTGAGVVKVRFRNFSAASCSAST
jgi:serine/threonine protein kinase